MTLIMCSAQRDFQFMVADRRITIPATGALVDDWAYKILQYKNRRQGYEFLIGYTGLARLGAKSTMEWLTESLPTVFDQGADIYCAINAFPDECQRQLARISSLQPAEKALTLVLCGRYNRFGPDPRAPEYTPFAAVISNCTGQHARQTGYVTPEFRAYSKRLLRPKQPPILLRYGDLRTARQFAREFKQAFRLMRKPLSYKAKVDIAIAHIREIADTTNTVGANVLGAALLQPGVSEAFDFPEDADIMTKTMPDVIYADGTQFTGFKVTPIDPDAAPRRNHDTNHH